MDKLSKSETAEVDLDKLLKWITAKSFDYGHGLLPRSEFVISSVALLDHLANQTGLSRVELGDRFDEARYRVHGEHLREEDRANA